MKVFLLWHMRPVDDAPDVDPEMVHIETEDKLCGAFSSEDEAQRARSELTRQPGFRDWPDAFLVDEHEVDEVQWTEGFTTVSCDTEVGGPAR